MSDFNPLFLTDSYKVAHPPAYPQGITKTFLYAESRGGQYARVVPVGLQYTLMKYFCRPFTMEHVEEARETFMEHMGIFPYEHWKRLYDKTGGVYPMKIRALPEGMVAPTHVALVTVESTIPEGFFVPGWFEPPLLRGLWYPTEVATRSWHCKQVIRGFLELTSDNPEAELPFKLHDFGARGVNCHEGAEIGGFGHLVNFQGSDTIEAIMMARKYYGCKMAAYSIPASEHACTTSWGKENELAFYRNFLKLYAKPGGLLAMVADSYDLYHAITEHFGKALREDIIKSGATVVVRPDSGDPVTVVRQCLLLLERNFGSYINRKGYRVLHNVRVIQGDGVNEASIRAILEAIVRAGFSATNVAFGMGGHLLQQLDRDTQKFALKCSEVVVDGYVREVFKDPKTDPGKASKRGRLDTIRSGTGNLVTVPVSGGVMSAMETIYEDGKMTRIYTLDEIRKLASETTCQQAAA